jgi:hypothetical protein
MLSFIKKFFSAKPTTDSDAPYKVETAKPAEFPFPSAKPAKAEKKPAVKKPAAKTNPARKPKTTKV